MPGWVGGLVAAALLGVGGVTALTFAAGVVGAAAGGAGGGARGRVRDRRRDSAGLPQGAGMIAVIVIALVAALVLVALGRAIRIVPQARAYVVERLGSYNRTLSGGFNTVVPGVDRVRSRIDLRE